MDKVVLENIDKMLKKYSGETITNINRFNKENKLLVSKCYEIEKSWSYSFAGWHGKMYFKDFKEPKLHEKFSPEWGGIHGIPDGWTEKDSEDVKKEIENKTGLSLNDLEKEGEQIKEGAEQVLREIIIILSSFDLSKLTEEQKLLSKLSEFKFGETRGEYIQKHIPKSIQTRDSEALSQGIYLPSHVYYLALGLSNISIGESIKTFMLLADQLVRQLKAKQKRITSLPNNNAWNFINPFWLIWKIILVVIAILKIFFRHKIVSTLFTILTLLAIDYSLAWKNVIFIWSWCSSFFTK